MRAGIHTAKVEMCGEYPRLLALASSGLPTANPTLSIADNAPEANARAIPTIDSQRVEGFPDATPWLRSRLIDAIVDRTIPTRSGAMPSNNRFQPRRSSTTAPNIAGPILPTSMLTPDTKALATATPRRAQVIPHITHPTPKRSP